MGGIVGENMYGYIADCTNNGTVTSSKWDKVGGIVGNNQIPDSSNEPVEGKSAVIERCVNNGAISGPNDNSGDYVGGIVGISSWSWEVITLALSGIALTPERLRAVSAAVL